MHTSKYYLCSFRWTHELSHSQNRKNLMQQIFNFSRCSEIWMRFILSDIAQFVMKPMNILGNIFQRWNQLVLSLSLFLPPRNDLLLFFNQSNNCFPMAVEQMSRFIFLLICAILWICLFGIIFYPHLKHLGVIWWLCCYVGWSHAGIIFY